MGYTDNIDEVKSMERKYNDIYLEKNCVEPKVRNHIYNALAKHQE